MSLFVSKVIETNFCSGAKWTSELFGPPARAPPCSPSCSAVINGSNYDQSKNRLSKDLEGVWIQGLNFSPLIYIPNSRIKYELIVDLVTHMMAN
jgi:hypothetical protein